MSSQQADLYSKVTEVFSTYFISFIYNLSITKFSFCYRLKGETVACRVKRAASIVMRQFGL